MRERPPTMHVFYSKTEDNPFLPAWYKEQLARDLDPIEAEIMLRGRWLARKSGDKIYHQYTRARNFRSERYQPNLYYPIRISWDFNIALGKPLSAVVFQYLEDKDEFHFFDQVVIEGLRTQESLEELAGKGILDLFEETEDGRQIPARFVVHGDAAGKHRDTRNNRSDYDIIAKFFGNFTQSTTRQRITYELQVPAANPGIKARHNLVNAYLNNSLGEVRLFVYETAPMLDKGFRLTKLKRGAQYAEDDSVDCQHITTAAGYGIHGTKIFLKSTRKEMRYL